MANPLIKLNFGLDVESSVAQFKEDIKNLESLIRSDKNLMVKIPVTIDDASLKNIESTIKQKLSEITLEGLDLSKALGNGKLNIGLDASSLKDLGIKIDVLTQAINNLTNALGGTIGSMVTSVGNVAKQVETATRSNAGIGGYAGVSSDGKYIGAAKGKGVQQVSVEDIIVGGGSVQKGAYDAEVARRVKEMVESKLHGKDSISEKTAEAMYGSIADIAKEAYVEFGKMASAKGTKHVEVPDDAKFAGMVDTYKSIIDGYVKAKDVIQKTPVYDISDKEVVSSEFFDDLFNTYVNAFGGAAFSGKALSKAYDEASKRLAGTGRGKNKKTVAPLTRGTKNEYLGITGEDEIEKQKELQEKTAEIEKSKADEAAKTEKLYKELTSDKKKEVAASNKTLSAEEKIMNASAEKARAEEASLDITKQAIANLEERGVIADLKKAFPGEENKKDYLKARDLAIDNEKASIMASQAAIKEVSEASGEEAKAIEAHTAAVEKQTEDVVVRTNTEQEFYKEQIANEKKTQKQKNKQNKEYLKAQEEVQSAFAEEKKLVEAHNEVLATSVETETVTNESVKSASKGISQKAIDTANTLLREYEHLYDARYRDTLIKGNIVKASDAYEKLTEALNDAGEQALKLFYGDDYASFRHDAKESGAKGSAEIRRIAQAAAKEDLVERINNIATLDENGNLFFPPDYHDKINESILSLERLYKEVMSPEDRELLKSLRAHNLDYRFGADEQKKLDTLAKSLEAASAEVVTSEQEADQARIKAGADLVSIARDTSLTLEEQFAKGLGLVGYGSVEEARSASSYITAQVARAMGINIGEGGALTAIEGRAEFLESFAKLQNYWRKEAYPSITARYDSASVWGAPALLNKAEIERLSTVLSDEQQKVVEEAIKAGKSFEELESILSRYAAENKDALQTENRQAALRYGPVTYQGGYNKIMDSISGPMYNILNVISRQRFGYPVLGGYDRSAEYIDTSHLGLLSEQARSLKDEIQETVKSLAGTLSESSEVWRQKFYDGQKALLDSQLESGKINTEEYQKELANAAAKAYSEGFQYLQSALRGELPKAEKDMQNAILDMVQGRMLGRVDDSTAVKMFDTGKTHAQLVQSVEMMGTANKLLNDWGVSQELIDRLNEQAISQLGAQLPILEEIVNLAGKYGIDWEILLDFVRNTSGELSGLVVSARLLSDELHGVIFEKLQGAAKALGFNGGMRSATDSTGINLLYGGEEPKTPDRATRITIGSNEDNLKAITEGSTAAAAAQRKVAQAAEEAASAEGQFAQAAEEASNAESSTAGAGDAAAEGTKKAGESARQASESFYEYLESLEKIERKYNSLIALIPGLGEELNSLYARNGAAENPLKEEEITAFEQKLHSIAGKRIGLEELNKTGFSTSDGNIVTYNEYLNSLIAKTQEAGNWTKSLNADWETISRTITTGGTVSQKTIADFCVKLQRANTDMSEFKNTAFESLKTQQLEQSFTSLGQKMTMFGEKYSRILAMNPQLNEAFNELQANFNNLNNSQGRTQENYNALINTMRALEQQARANLTPLQKLGIRIKQVFGERLMFMASTMLVSQVFTKFRELYTAVSDVDKAMTELKKVTDLTADAYDSFLTRASSKAKELGATISDYVDATADFARLGYNMADAENLATTATVYKNVGNGIDSISTASESIISTMKAFGIEAKNSMDIVDAFNEVGNNFAISSTGIGEALQRSASALATANNDLDESIALVVAGNAVVQNPDTVGTALKTLSMRIRGAKTELEQAGESTEGMTSSISKLRSEVSLLTGNKVDIMLDDKTFKSTYEILRDISKVWNDISDVDQANLLELLGGKRNANVLSSILTNFEDAEAVIKTIAGDAGSAMMEQEKWLDSIEGKTQQLKAAGQGLAIDLINTDAAKNALSIITSLINGVDLLAKNIGFVVSGLSLFGSMKIFSNIKSVALTITNIGKSLDLVFDSLMTSMENVSSPIKNVSEAMKEAKLATDADVGAAESNTAATYTYIGAKEAEIGATEGSAEASLEDSAAKKTQESSMKGVTTASVGLATALGIAAAAFSLIMLVVSSVNKSIREHEQEVENSKKAYEDAQSNLDNYVEKIKKAREELKDAQGEQARYEKTEELKVLQQELVDLYGKQAESIDLINGKLDTEIEKVKNLSAEEARNYWTEANKKNVLGQTEVEKALKKYRSNQSFTVAWNEDQDPIEDFIKSRTKNYNKLDNSFVLTGSLEEQKRIINELYEYVNDKNNHFEDMTKQSINDAYTEVVKKAKETEPLIESYGDTYFKQLGPSEDDFKDYERYTKLVEDLKKAVNDGDMVEAGELRQKIIKSYKKDFEGIPDIAREELKKMYMDAAPYEVRVKLKILEQGAATDKELNSKLEKYKNKYGQIDISGVDKKSDEWKELEKSAKNYTGSIEDVIDAINEYNGIDIEDKFNNKENKNSLADQIDNILEAEAGFEKLQKMFWDVKDGGQFDYGSLRQKDFLETFNIEGMEDAYNSFLETVAQYPNDINKCQDAFNNLTTEYIKQTGILDDLTEKNKTLTIAWLKNIGVANAEEIVNAKLHKSITLSAEGYAKLNEIAGETIKASQDRNGAYKVEESELSRLGMSAQDMAMAIALAQQDATISTIEGARTRLTALQQEAKAYSQLYQAEYDMAQGVNPGMVHGRTKNLSGEDAEQVIKNAKQYASIRIAAEEALANLPSATYTPPNPNKSSSGGSGKDTYLEEWKQQVKIKKDLLEQDQITEKEYYDWLRTAYKAKGGPGWSGLSAEKQKEYADEVASIQSELYKWEKDQIQKSIDEQDAILKNKRANGLISEAEYQKQLGKITEDGYKELKRKVEEEDLFGVDTTERLNAETELLEKIKSAHNAAYNAEIEDLEHLRTMNLITDEQYYAKHAALVREYYADEKMYAEELKKEEEKLYKERIDLIKKYSSAAKEAISSIMNIGKSLADAVGNLVQNMINANSSNFDLQKKQLKHWLNMNYITEKDYYDQLEELYQKYYKSKAIYLDEYWENQEEIYQYEISSMQDGASALESLHAKVVDMIKQELADAKKAIEDAKDAYNELIDIRRKALEREKDNEDAEQSRIEQLSKIADLQRQVNALENDTSAQGQRKYKQKYAELIKAQREYEKFEREQAYKDAQNQLEDEKDAIELAAKHQTKAIDDYLEEDSEAIVNDAWARLKGLNADLYDDLMEYTRKHSTSIKNEIIDSWKKANESFEEYKDNLKETYEDWENRLIYPENYYGGDYAGGIGYDENGNVNPNDPRYAEMAYDSYSTERKELENWRKVIGDFAEDMGGIIGDGAQSVAKIIETLFPGPVADLFADGADMFASSMGAIGISNSMLETVALLGGTAGVLEMMRGLQDIAQGKDGSGVVIGGESIDNIQELLQRISDYQQIMIGNETLGALINGVIGAIGSGPTDGSSVVTALLTMGTSMGSLLSLATLLAGGGGAGLAGLLSAISGLGSLFSYGNEIEADGNNKLISLLIRVCEWTGGILDKSEANGRELGALRTLLHNSWVGVYEIVSKLATSLTSSNVLSGFAGGMSALSTVFKTMLTSGNGYIPLSGEGLGENLLKVLTNPNGLISDTITKSIKLITATIPEINSGGNKTVEMQNLFNIESSDPQGVADEITKLLPQIATYTINAMVDNMGSKGVKRSAYSY